MKKLYLIILLAATCFMSDAKAVLDFFANRCLIEYQQNISPATATQDSISVIISVAPDADMSSIEESCDVLRRRGDMCMVSLPVSNLEALSKTDGVRRISLGDKMRVQMYESRIDTQVDDAHLGLGTLNGRKFTGEGVVVGLMDVGLDPNHINFYDNAGVYSRVKRLAKYTNPSGVPTLYETPSAISEFTTDKSSETHGTHVLGIMAGAYSNHLYDGVAHGFQGVAPGADIVVGCGELYSVNILDAIERIIAYAESVGKPAVVNLSLGTSIGPHDGTDDICRYLDELGEQAIICISSGNEAGDAIALTKTFVDSDCSLKTFVGNSGYDGAIDIWSSNQSPLTISIGMYDEAGNLKTELINSSSLVDGKTYTVTTQSSSSGEFNLDFAKAFSGSIKIKSVVDEWNNRYNVVLDCDFMPVTSAATRYYIGLVITGADGTRVDAYCDNTTKFTNVTTTELNGWAEGGADGSINNMACGQNVVVVGAYSSHDSFIGADGQSHAAKQAIVGDIAYFSSWGNLVDGRQLPDVCAPGYPIISSLNSYYAAARPEANYATSFEQNSPLSISGNQYYWGPQSGTSMSAPFVSGTVALWLQADPTLTVSDVKKIIAETSTRDSYVTSSSTPAAWGAGKINAYNGLLAVLDQAGIDGVEYDSRLLVTPIADNQYEVFVAGETDLSVSVYSMTGRRVAMASVSNDRLTIDVSALPEGVYLLSVSGKMGVYSERIVIK